MMLDNNSFTDQMESIRLDLNNGQITKIENIEPYALFGDTNGDFNGGSIPLGDNTLDFELYSKNKAQGELLDTVKLNFTLV